MEAYENVVGFTEIKSPRTTIQEAYTYGLIENGEQWIGVMIDHSKTPHLYDKDEAKLVYEKVKRNYSHLLSNLCEKLEEEVKKVN